MRSTVVDCCLITSSWMLKRSLLTPAGLSECYLYVDVLLIVITTLMACLFGSSLSGIQFGPCIGMLNVDKALTVPT